jgi:type IV secretory pathway VirB2 component (pilin)
MNAISSHRSAASRADCVRADSTALSTVSKVKRLYAQAASKIARVGQQLSTWWLGLSLTLFCAAAQAQAVTPNFDSAKQVMQAFVTFMTGPFGKAAVVISIVAAFITWVFAPKEGIFGPILRVVVAGIAILNAALWIGQFGQGTTITL